MNANRTIRIATRGSKLALWQANYVKRLLEQRGFQSDLIVIKTEGDVTQNKLLHEIGGKGLFIKELEGALLSHDADIAVHSLKDMPAKQPHPFQISAILPRHDPRDAIIFHPNESTPFFPKGSIIGRDAFSSWGKQSIATASLRRQGLLKAMPSSLELLPIRGNVDTRIEKLRQSKWSAIILAAASLERLSLNDTLHYAILDHNWFIPAPGQGALAIESLVDSPLENLLDEMSCKKTRTHVSIERELLHLLGGDCTMPFGCYLWESNARNTLARAIVMDAEGNKAEIFHEFENHNQALDIEKSAKSLYEDLLTAGCEKILKNLKLQIPNLGKL